ncbi:hypothetical protein L210DRAFT_3635996 [Boletus edulis BED1]|uniref:Uncharacterized protein n=1 Tax=Boletus edulis BED1 TaxID=1328754 RepID=A0AAD4BCU1_BOLED|nr:hypothetical protein L210DRAFT_3635996 [Boletus edulis BED1]
MTFSRRQSQLRCPLIYRELGKEFSVSDQMDDERFPSEVAPNERLSLIKEDKRATAGFGGSLPAQRKRETWVFCPRRDNQSTRRKGVALPQEIHVGNKQSRSSNDVQSSKNQRRSNEASDKDHDSANEDVMDD